MTNNLITEDITKIFTTYLKKYNKLIRESFGHEEAELMSLWDRVVNPKEEVEDEEVDAPSSPCTPPRPPQKEKKPPGAPKKPKKESPAGCPYMFTKGAKEGQTCGSRAKGGNTYCSRHKKYEGRAPKVKRSLLPPPRRSIVSANKKKKAPKKHQDVVLHKGPAGKLYHRPTGLVFGRDKVAIGTWLRAAESPSGGDEIIPLTKSDIEKAKKHMFAFRVEDPQTVEEATRKVTRALEPHEAKKLERSLSSAIAATNIQAKDVDEILCELQTRNSASSLEEEEIDDEDNEEEILEEED